MNHLNAFNATAAKLGRVQLNGGQTAMFTILRHAGENLGAKSESTRIRASRLC